MSLSHRSLRLTALALGIVLLLAAFVLVARSNSFQAYVRGSVLAALEKTTGTRAEVRSFGFDWQNLSVHLSGLTLHGTEGAAEPPFLTVRAVDLQLRVLSFLGRQVELRSLVMQSPRFYLTVRPDGSANLPGPSLASSKPDDLARQLLEVQIPSVEITNGEAQFNQRRIPLNLAVRNVRLALTYQPLPRQYQVALHSDRLELEWNANRYSGAVALKAVLGHNGVAVQDATLDGPDLHLAMVGRMQGFVHPTLDWHVRSQFATRELTRTLALGEDLQGGSIAIEGSGHQDPNTPFTFRGTLTAQDLNAHIASVELHNATVISPLIANSTSLWLAKAEVTTSELHFAGEAKLDNARQLSISGQVDRVNVPALASFAIGRRLPIASTGAGSLELSATLLPYARDLTLATNLRLSPVPGTVPVSGQVRLSYHQKNGSLELKPSQIFLPHTVLSAHGLLPSSIEFALQSANLSDLTPLLALSGRRFSPDFPPVLAASGSARAHGTLLWKHGQPTVTAAIAANGFVWKNQLVDSLSVDLSAAGNELSLSHLAVRAALGSLEADVYTHLTSGRLQATGRFSGARIDSLLRLTAAAQAGTITGGVADGSFNLDGTLSNPQGSAELTAHKASVKGEFIDALHANLTFRQPELQIEHGWVRFAKTEVRFSGSFVRGNQTWRQGALTLNLNAAAVPLARLQPLLPGLPNISGNLTVHAQTVLDVGQGQLSPRSLAGNLNLENITIYQAPFGNFRVTATTQSRQIQADLTGDLNGNPVSGSADFQIAPGTPAMGKLHFAGLNLQSLVATLRPELPLPQLTGTANGDLAFSGPLEHPRQMHAVLHLQHIEVSDPGLQRLTALRATPQLLFQNQGPVTLEVADGIATVRQLELTGLDTHVTAAGTAELTGRGALAVHLDGAVNLRLLQLLYPQWQIGGTSKIQASLAGTLSNPAVAGSVQLINGSVLSPDLPSGLSNLHGTIQFDGNRATLEGVEAHTGGGQISLSGFATYTPNHPAVYRLDAHGQNIRVRYANGVSATANSQLSLTGTDSQALLTGGITVSRVIFNPSTDVGNLLAVTAGQSFSSVDNRGGFLSRLGLDLRIESAPDLQLDTALSTGIQAEINLQVRGTPRQPILLGTIEANEGDIKVFGSRYSINRGQVSFTNPGKFEPILDLDLQTEARGITVDITVSGTLSKLNLNYRSDPPLQPREIIALLTVGRTPDTATSGPNVQTTNDPSALQSGANSVLGQVISPASSRLSKLFGITNIKIDPLVQGITNTPQARLTLEQQVSRQITVTYITNLSQTSEQVFRVEYSLNRQFSLVALRDDNGEFGIDILYKKRFK